MPVGATMSLALLLAVLPAHAGLDALGFDDTEATPLLPVDLGGFPPAGGPPSGPDADPEAVVGGEVAEDGRWPDAAGVVFDGAYVGCTGTLVAPDVVLTAAHCVGGISHVILDTTNWLLRDEGEVIEVRREVAHPGGADIAVLLLDRPARTPHRTIARDCVIDDELRKGAPVVVVGFGATRSDGRGNTTRLHEGTTRVQTPDCSAQRVDGIWTGCDPRLDPASEIGAGGNSVDACFGDSGGPLYLPTDDGTFLIGVTSRAYAGVPEDEPCAHGGIYTRPDAVIGWIERVAGHPMPYPPCNDVPAVDAQPLAVPSGATREVELVVDDPDGETWDAEVVVPPEHGVIAVEDGVVTYTADAGYAGEDAFTLAVHDDGSAEWPDAPRNRVEVEVAVEVVSCGCATGPGPAGLWGLGALGLLVRRRRRSVA